MFDHLILCRVYLFIILIKREENFPFYFLKALLDAKWLAKLFSKATKNNLIHLIVYRVCYRKLTQRLLKEGKE